MRFVCNLHRGLFRWAAGRQGGSTRCRKESEARDAEKKHAIQRYRTCGNNPGDGGRRRGLQRQTGGHVMPKYVFSERRLVVFLDGRVF